jgi:hypothetical protein
MLCLSHEILLPACGVHDARWIFLNFSSLAKLPKSNHSHTCANSPRGYFRPSAFLRSFATFRYSNNLRLDTPCSTRSDPLFAQLFTITRVP